MTAKGFILLPGSQRDRLDPRAKAILAVDRNIPIGALQKIHERYGVETIADADGEQMIMDIPFCCKTVVGAMLSMSRNDADIACHFVSNEVIMKAEMKIRTNDYN